MSMRVNVHSAVSIVFSDRRDGSMAAGGGQPLQDEHQRNAENILRAAKLPHANRTPLYVTYGADRTYVDVERVTKHNMGQPLYADAAYTTVANAVISLPVADCVATVVFDPKTAMLGVLHLGRHSSVAGLIEHFIIDVADTLGSDPRDWHVWMSPSLRLENDQLEYFDPPEPQQWEGFVAWRNNVIHIDTVGHNVARFVRAGVEPSRVVVADADTFSDDKYFSHRAAMQGKADKQGRMALFASINPDA